MLNWSGNRFSKQNSTVLRARRVTCAASSVFFGCSNAGTDISSLPFHGLQDFVSAPHRFLSPCITPLLWPTSSHGRTCPDQTQTQQHGSKHTGPSFRVEMLLRHAYAYTHSLLSNGSKRHAKSIFNILAKIFFFIFN
jgi:hypothetical protein